MYMCIHISKTNTTNANTPNSDLPSGSWTVYLHPSLPSFATKLSPQTDPLHKIEWRYYKSYHWHLCSSSALSTEQATENMHMHMHMHMHIHVCT